MHTGNGLNMIYVDPEHDVVAVVRWIQTPAADGFVKRLLAAVTDKSSRVCRRCCCALITLRESAAAAVQRREAGEASLPAPRPLTRWSPLTIQRCPLPQG